MYSKRLTSESRFVITGIIFVLPALLLFILIVYYPLIKSAYYSMTDWTGMSNKYNFIGFKNFINLFSEDLVMAGIKNTITLALYCTIVGNILSLILALILDSELRLKNYYRALFYLPCLLSPIIVSAVFGNILQYQGLLNAFFEKAGLGVLVWDWFGTKLTALPMIMGLSTWQWSGYGAIVYLAGLQSIPVEYYEAAKIDGASKRLTFFKVTLPLLMPAITIMSFLSITGGLKTFEIPFALTKGGPGNATETIGTAIYNLAFSYERMGFATALAIVFFLFIAVVSVTQVVLTRRKEVEL